MLAPVRRFALAAVGGDRPGIVAQIARVLLEHELNIEDSQMAILRGRFCVLLILAGADDVGESALRADLERAGDELSLDALALSALGDAPRGASAAGRAAAGSCIVTVYGADHPGIVHAVAAKLAPADVNITDLQTQLVSSDEAAPLERAGGEDLERAPGGSLYAMIIECDLPVGMDVEALEQLLADVRSEQSVDVAVRELERDVL